LQFSNSVSGSFATVAAGSIGLGPRSGNRRRQE
jgi:hypothetical protein